MLTFALLVAIAETWIARKLAAARREYREIFPQCTPAIPRVPAWSERTPAEIAAWEDAQWGRAIKRVAARMAPVYACA